MKIALITDTYYTINGVSRTYQRLAKYCQKKNIRLDIFTLGPNRQQQKKGSVNIYQFAASWPVKYYYDLPPFDIRIISPGLKEKFSQTKYDVIHLATPGSLGIAARVMLSNNPTPKVGVFHTLVAEYAGSWTEKGLENLPDYIKYSLTEFSQAAVWQFLKWFYAKTDVVLAPSQTIRKKLKILNRPLEIFPRGVDTEVFNPKHRSKKTKKLTALYVGRLSTEKNLDLLVKIFKKRNDIELWLVGDGPYQKGLKAQLPKAKFFGYLTGKKLSQAYANADFFVFPSITDTFGNAVLEAQASGLPVIVTNVGGPQELVKNKADGLVVKPNPQSFNQALNWLINNKKQRRIMSQKARISALKRSWPKAFSQLFKIYQELATYKKLKK